MKLIFNLILASSIFSLSACGNTDQSEQSSGAKKADQGRAETKSIQAADAVGYDGSAIRSKLDTALDAKDQRAAELGKEIDAQTGGTEKPDE